METHKDSRSSRILKMVIEKISNSESNNGQVLHSPSEILKMISVSNSATSQESLEVDRNSNSIIINSNVSEKSLTETTEFHENFDSSESHIPVFDKIFKEMQHQQYVDHQTLHSQDNITSDNEETLKNISATEKLSSSEIQEKLEVVSDSNVVLFEPNDTVIFENHVNISQYCEQDVANDSPIPKNDVYSSAYTETQEISTASLISNSEQQYNENDPDDPDYLFEDILDAGVESSKKKLTRWKKAAPETWARNACKRQRSQSKEFKTKKGIQKAKRPQPVHCGTCRFQCTQHFSEEDREEICKTYWALEYTRKKDYILKFVKQGEPQRRRVCTDSGKNRALCRAYFFQNANGSHRVCQKFFTKTLNITDGPIIHAFKNINASGFFDKPDERGKAPSVNKTPDSDVEKVKKHIEKFPVMESHYCRKSSSRSYLDPELSIPKMYELYCTECKEDNVKPVGPTTYRRIFCGNYNYSFFHPKKDQCLTCTNFHSATPEEKLLLEEAYKQHKATESAANKAKEEDKGKSNANPEFICATFDLQSVLQIPSAQTYQLYYTHKLCVYNLCIYESKIPNNGYCIAWNEINGKRGSTEIGSAVLWWLQQLPDTIKEDSLFSDTCGGQNRNQHIAALFLYAVQTMHFDVIEHKFLESGHSYMEVDSMHSAIEKQKKNVPVYSMIDWLNVFRTARSSRKRKNAQPYVVKELKFNEMANFKDLSKELIKNRNKNENGAEVSWLKIKCLRYEKSEPNVIQYKYDYSDPYMKINTLQVKGRPLKNPVLKLSKAYEKSLPISKEKKNDLERMCKLKIIPTELHGWFKSLTTSKCAGNRAPQPGAESEDDSECE